MTTAPATTIRTPTFTVVNPQAEPTDQWIRAVARLLLSAADRKLAERTATAAGDGDQAGDDHQHGGVEL